MLISRLIVAAILLTVVISTLSWGELWLWQLLTAPVAMGAAREWALLSGLNNRSAIGYALMSGIMMLLFYWLINDNESAMEIALGGVCLFWAVGAPLMMLSMREPRRIVLCIIGMGVIPAAWYASVWLFVEHLYALPAVLAIVWTADSMAYFTGKRWGKSKMSPRISPGKTWEGLVGGAIAVLLLVSIAGPVFFAAPSLPWLLSAAFVIVALSVLGDLLESFLKRHYGVKDSGRLLGAHGGILDRLDSTLSTLPFAALLSLWLT